MGCRVGAKNTLAQNYLRVAKRHHAEIVTQTEVRFVLPHPAGGWEIHARAHPLGGGPPTDHVVRAAAVVIAAGALGSTAILLRSRVRGLRLGRRVGHHFGGNADRAGYGYNNDTFIGAIGRRDAVRHPRPVGPTIASMTLHTDQRGRQFLIQEGAVPSPLVLPTRVLLAAAAATRGEDTDAGAADAAREALRIARDAFALGDEGALAHTMLMLAMGDDDADGRVILDSREAPRVVWGGLADKPIFRAMDAEMRAQVAALGGTWVSNPNPLRGFGGPPMTVHPLGGVPMGDDVDAGVVDHLGRVFDPDGGVLSGLYVVDGSAVPTSLRVNPMLTIAALAERVAEAVDPASVGPAPGPAAARAVPPAPVGLSFTETMTGWFDAQTTHLGDTRAFLERDREVRLARRSSGRVPAPVSFRLTITVDDLDTFLADRAHLASAEGHVDGPWGQKRLVEQASFNLLVDAAEPDTKKTHYVLCFRDEDGVPLRLEGEKRVHDDDGHDSFADATTLFVTVREGFAPGGAVKGQGVMHIEGPDLLRQLTTFRAHRAPTFEASVTALSRFGAFFFGNLWEPFVRPRLFGPEAEED